jgi:hypothetical protein
MLLRGDMRTRASASFLIAGIFTFLSPVFAQDAPANRNATTQFITSRAKAWAEQACGGKWVISEILAEDFRGTSPKGTRYEKPSGEPEYDPTTQWSTDCRLDQADVRFFGPDVAVVYGAESKTITLPDGKHERRCLVWTDTWLHRKGKWQIIAVQDNRIDCAAQ